MYACVRLYVHSVVVRRVKGGERGWFKHPTATPQKIKCCFFFLPEIPALYDGEQPPLGSLYMRASGIRINLRTALKSTEKPDPLFYLETTISLEGEST